MSTSIQNQTLAVMRESGHKVVTGKTAGADAEIISERGTVVITGLWISAPPGQPVEVANDSTIFGLPVGGHCSLEFGACGLRCGPGIPIRIKNSAKNPLTYYAVKYRTE